MLARRKIDYYPTAVVLLVFGLDLTVLAFSNTIWMTIIWSLLMLNIKGFICCWNHHHQHCKFFRYEWANRLLETIMGLQTGAVGEGWSLHHTLGHHLNYLDQTKDESAWKTPDGRIMGRLEYSLTVALLTYPKAIKVGMRHPKLLKKLIENFLITGLILALMCWVNWVNTLILFILPMAFLLFMTVNETYDHHTGLEVDDPYQATYNITNRWYNFFTCNLGYHTAHHITCGKHWSELPQFHEEIKHKIPSNLYREPASTFLWMSKLEQLITGQRQVIN